MPSLTYPDKRVIAERYILSQNPVLYLPLWKRDGSVIPSEDAYGHSCTVTGALWTSQGRSFDGDDIVVTPTITLATDGKYTVSCMVKVSALPGTYYCLLGGPTPHPALIMGPSGFNVGRLGVSVGSNVAYTIPLNSFLNVTAVIQGPSVGPSLSDIYVNGLFIGTSTEANGYALSSRLFNLGAATGVLDIPLTGTLGEAQVFNRALSASEVLNHYLTTKWRYR